MLTTPTGVREPLRMYASRVSWCRRRVVEKDLRAGWSLAWCRATRMGRKDVTLGADILELIEGKGVRVEDAVQKLHGHPASYGYTRDDGGKSRVFSDPGQLCSSFSN